MKEPIVTTVTRRWEDITFDVVQGDYSSRVELYFSRETREFRIESPHEEAVKYDGILQKAILTHVGVERALEHLAEVFQEQDNLPGEVKPNE